MADQNYNINLVVKNLKDAKKLKDVFKDAAISAERIENKIKAINAGLNRAKQKFNTVNPDQPRDAKGRFAQDPDRNRRRNAYAELRFQKARQVMEKRNLQNQLRAARLRMRVVKMEEAGSKKRAEIEEKLMQKQLRLSAAKGLVSRKIREAGSAGLSPLDFAGGEGKRPREQRAALNQQVTKLKTEFSQLDKAGSENIQTYRALGSELSRVVEQLNALNRASAKRSIGYEKGRRLQERIAAIDPIKRKTKSGAEVVGTGKARDFGQGAAAQRARGLASKVIAAADTGDQNLYNQALSKATAAISRLEREYKQGEKALKEERRLRKIGVKARRRAASKRADIQGRFRESLMLGAGFPLLFGGGVGAVAGGVGGAIAQRGGKGFGAQIFFSAIGQQFDALISSMIGSAKKLGDALGQYTQNTEQLVTSLGLAGTAEGQRIEIIKKLQGEQAAFNAALQRLTSVVGTVGVQRLKDFGDKWRDIMMSFQERMVKLQAALAGVLIVVDKIIGTSKVAREDRILAFARQSGNANLKSLVQQYDETPTSYRFRKQRKDLKGQILEQATPGFNQMLGGTAVDNIMMKQKELTKTLEEEFAVHAKILELQEKKGLSAELAKSVAQEAVTIDKTTEALQERFNELKDKGINKTLEEVELQKAIKQALDGQSDALDKIIQKKKNMSADTEKVKVKWEDIKETIASGLTSAVEGLIAGTKSLGESLAGIAKSIASMYLKAAFMNMLPGLAEGGYVSNGIKPFSSGGMVTRPTVGLVGEAGEDEYIIPASKMAASMQRYSAGARGEAVIPGTGSSHVGGGGGASTTVNYSGPILNFNSEEFVPKSAVGQIIATATSRGAKAGEARALSSLQNSRSRRSNIGL